MNIRQSLLHAIVRIGVEHITGIPELLHDLRAVQGRIPTSLGIAEHVAGLPGQDVLCIAALPVIDVAHDNHRLVRVLHRQIQNHPHGCGFGGATDRGDGRTQRRVVHPVNLLVIPRLAKQIRGPLGLEVAYVKVHQRLLGVQPQKGMQDGTGKALDRDGDGGHFTDQVRDFQ